MVFGCCDDPGKENSRLTPIALPETLLLSPWATSTKKIASQEQTRKKPPPQKKNARKEAKKKTANGEKGERHYNR